MARHSEKSRRRRKLSRELRPQAECLEDRKLLYATLGGQWTYGSRITYSFAPDGTDVGGLTSSWNKRMSDLGIAENVWKDQFRKAAATWSFFANINMVEVSDDGSGFSVPGNQQGDSRFGDIRIAGVGLSSNVLASALLPPPFNGGTLAGDIVMNSNANWGVNTTYDLMSVALHEFGHSLGMDHSTISQAVMYYTYGGQKQLLTNDDIAGVRSIYDARQPDPFEGASGNNQHWLSTYLNPYINSQQQIRLATPDINSTIDNDWYYVIAPVGTTGTLTVSMQSKDLSSLSPRVQVLNTSLQTIGLRSAPGAFGATVTLTVNGVQPGQGFFIRAMAASSGPTGAGSYGLLVNFGSNQMDPIAPPNTVVPEGPSGGGGSINQGTNGGRTGANPAALGLLWGRDRKNGKPDGEETGDLDLVVRIGTLQGIGEMFGTEDLSHIKTSSRNTKHVPFGWLVPMTMMSSGRQDNVTIPIVTLGQQLGLDGPTVNKLVDDLLAKWFADDN